GRHGCLTCPGLMQTKFLRNGHRERSPLSPPRRISVVSEDQRKAQTVAPLIGQIIPSLIWPPSMAPLASASRAIFSKVGQCVRRYFCACTFVGKLVCNMHCCRVLPLAI